MIFAGADATGYMAMDAIYWRKWKTVTDSEYETFDEETESEASAGSPPADG